MRPILLRGHTRPMSQLVYSREGDLLFSSGKDSIATAWYSDNGERLGTYEGHNGAVYSLDVDAQTSFLVTGSADGYAFVWDVETGKKLYSIDHGGKVVHSVSISVGSEFLLTATDPHQNAPSKVMCWSLDELKQTGQCSEPVFETNYTKAATKINRAKWGPCNETFVTAGEDGVVRQWDGVNGDPLNMDKEYEAPITDINFSADGTIFIASSTDHTAKVYDAYDMNIMSRVQSDRPLNSAIMSPIKEHIICGGGQDASKVTTTGSSAGKFEILFQHMIYGNRLGDIKGHFGPVNTLAFSPDGTSFASGGEDGTIRIHHFDPEYYALSTE